MEDMVEGAATAETAVDFVTTVIAAEAEDTMTFAEARDLVKEEVVVSAVDLAVDSAVDSVAGTAWGVWAPTCSV